MNVLGMFGATDVVHPAACLLRDGRVVAFVEEERFARVKQACGLFPAQATAWCLREGGLTLREIEALAVPWDANANWFRMPVAMARSFVRDKLTSTYETRVTAYNLKAEAVNATKESHEKSCVSRRYDERDLNDIKRKK